MPSEAIPSCRFYLQIGSDTNAVFSEVSGLQLEIDATAVEEGGNNAYVHRLPGRVKAGTVTFKRGLARSNEFLEWLIDVSNGMITKHDVTVVLYDVPGTVLRRWTLQDAFPTKWVGPQLQAGSNSVAVETLELAHSGMKLR